MVVSHIEKAIKPAHALLQPLLKERRHKGAQMSASEEITLGERGGRKKKAGEVETSGADVKLAFTRCCIDKVI